MTPKPTPEQHLRKHIIWAHGKVAVFSPPDAATGGNIALMAADELERLRKALGKIAAECSTFPIKDGLAFRCESIARNVLTS
jgi:hypothetical protein